MAGYVAHAPGGGGAAARQLRRDVHDRDEIELHSAESLGLMKTEQPALVQELLVLADEHAGVFALRGALAQNGDDVARPLHRLVVADGREITAHRLRQGAHRRCLIHSSGSVVKSSG